MRPQPEGAFGLLLFLLLVVVLVIAFAWQVRAWSFLCDDAFISFRYARNWAERGQIVYNVQPLEFVEGYTNPLWVAVLAFGSVVGVDPQQLAPILTRLSAVAAIIACVCFVSLLRHHGWVSDSNTSTARDWHFTCFDLGAAALLISVPQFMVWSNSGLEASFAAALAIWSVCACLMRRMKLCASLLMMTGLARLDGLIWPTLWILGLLSTRHIPINNRSWSRIPWRSYGGAIVIVVVPLLLHLLWRHEYYGSWLPNTWWIKRHGMSISDSWGTWYLRSWAQELGLLWVVPLLVVVRVRHAVAIIPLFAVLIYTRSVGGDFMAYHRFLLPATLSWAILICWLSQDLAHKLKWSAVRLVAMVIPLVTASLLASVLPSRLARDRQENWIDGRWESVTAMDRFAKIRFAAGVAMSKLVREDEEILVSVGAAGAFPYASRFPVFDVYGLVDPELARRNEAQSPRSGKSVRPGHQIVASHEYVVSRQPDLMCHNGWAGRHRPSVKQARRRGGSGYRWLCVQTGPMEDRRSINGLMDSQHYCCLAKKERLSTLMRERNP